MGDLAHTLLSEKIRSLSEAKRSGILVVSSSDVTKGVFLRAGQIVFAASTLEEDKLGESLIRLGRISRRDFARAYDATREKKRRLGEELVGAGVVTVEELGKLVAHQAQKIILSLFKWEKGEMVFQEADDPIPADLALDLSTHRLLLEGARIFPDSSRLEKALGRQSRRLRLSTHPPFDYSRFVFSPAERTVLNDAADELKVSEMLAHPAPRALLVHAVYALLAGGIVTDAEAREEELEVVEVDSGTFQMGLPPGRKAHGEGTRARVLSLYEALPRATHYEVLGVAPDATRPALEEAFKRLAAERERDWQDLHDMVPFSSMLSTLRLRQHEAFRVLTDAQARRTYDGRLGRIVPPKPGAAAAAPRRGARLAREAERLLGRGEAERAIAVLLEAVAADPRDAAARRLLALTLARHKTLTRTAERHFIAALQLNPKDLELRYELALYYKRSGLARRAVSHLRAVLAAEPGHPGARRELGAVEKA